jgi:endonuclease/exonuclease/phosphatase family metal-dependent hydrolase
MLKILPCLLLIACSSSAPTVLGVCADIASDGESVAVTFNAALGPGLDVPHVGARIGPVSEAVVEMPWDVLCLNEIWTDEAAAAILARLGLPDSHAFSHDTRGRNEDPADRCAPGELDDGLDCIRRECPGLPDEDLSRCALDRCRAEGFSLLVKNRDCFDCVVASAGQSVEGIAQTCYGSGASKLYGGRNGVILVSRSPLRDTEAIELPSSYANRVALFATVDVGGRAIEVACTHITAARDLIPPTETEFADWNQEMIAQIALASERLEARAGGRPQLLLGDLNTGPSFDGDMDIDAEPVWNSILASGFLSPAATSRPSICSRCRGNLIAPTDGRLLIDHVLTRQLDGLAPSCAAQAFDAPVTVIDSTGSPIMTNLSDHYGIAVRLFVR